MERFDANYKGGKIKTVCPLCLTHEDGQMESLKCRIIVNKIYIQGNYKNIFEDIESYPKLINTISKISQIRKQILIKEE